MRINTERGILTDFVVQYETPTSELSHEHVAVVRYDGSHHRAHRDLLDVRGRTVRKSWLPEHFTFSEAFGFAVADIEQNWPRYRQDFLLRSRG
ncbi:MAG: hypothetical protein H0W06_09710 [Chloroflexia bacterium]|nr:hypothetical protein [Chloroflexia bacterium]